jgi:hypothetical protein
MHTYIHIYAEDTCCCFHYRCRNIRMFIQCIHTHIHAYIHIFIHAYMCMQYPLKIMLVQDDTSSCIDFRAENGVWVCVFVFINEWQKCMWIKVNLCISMDIISMDITLHQYGHHFASVWTSSDHNWMCVHAYAMLRATTRFCTYVCVCGCHIRPMFAWKQRAMIVCTYACSVCLSISVCIYVNVFTWCI